MSDHLSTNPWETISDGWGGFQGCHANNYYNPAPHDEEAEDKAQLDFAMRTEAAIRGMFPDNLTDLAQDYAKFASEDLAVVLRDASWDGPEEFYQRALHWYQQHQTANLPDILDFARFVKGFEQVVRAAWDQFKSFPDTFFNIYHEFRDELLEHIFEVVVDLLVGQLRSGSPPRSSSSPEGS